MKIHKIIILGSGPAGCTAAIYAARAELFPLVIEGMQPGGQLTITTEIENYPGYTDGIMGPQLMQIMKEQAERFGTEFIFGEVSEVDLSKKPFTIKTENDETFQAHTLIIATGARARLLNIEAEKKLMGYGVSACATCDGFFFKEKEICIVGGGDTAMEEASFLTRFASRVTVIHRRDELRASKIMQERAQANPKISFEWNSVIEDIEGSPETGVQAAILKDTKTGETRRFPTQGIFIAIGHTPNTAVFKGKLDMDDQGYIRTRGTSTYTSVDGVFAAGDVADHVYRQAITAAGMGCKAAIDAERWLAEHQIA
ncbi:MAG TPA: thioredoxin-disulfide reductase [Thermoanaerobaculia bacterium]|nr:thioredoxin-disulfide reductase [Thermoanaerobaculia bacterium]HUM31142.1 thioredoxin-disulfide reductase [Thermoanaerobaculia bacterium]HXK69498.1 thioredoxin-disulfide reductase [Thermoanaerobaculia bacterium]